MPSMNAPEQLLEHPSKRLSEREFLVPPHAGWNASRYFCLYRLLLASLLLTLAWLDRQSVLLELRYVPSVYVWAVHAYFAAALLMYVAARNRWPGFPAHLGLQIAVDVVVLTLLIYTSTGLHGGLGMCLLIAVSGLSVLSSRKLAIFTASLASLAILGGEVYTWLLHHTSQPSYTHAGLLGFAFFFSAGLLQSLASRATSSEKLVTEQAAFLSDLSRLNEHIVQHMHLGILVIDVDEEVRLCNPTAEAMLSVRRGKGRKLRELSPALRERVQDWVRDGEDPVGLLSVPESGMEARLNFVELPTSPSFAVLILMEDAAVFKQRVQQMKLASLGRLTAGIAHEVRNPLGAISQAGQLLSESSGLREQDRRLADMIVEHARRMNRIVENVSGLSRRSGEMEQMDLSEWLRGFVQELKEHKRLSDKDIHLEVRQEPLLVSVDASQLYQVLWNLAENALRYSAGVPLLTFSCGTEKDRPPFLEVRDQGGGIHAEQAEHLFEPFFTTEPQGSGMGLYIAKELCEANQVRLFLSENSPQGCCFRMDFAPLPSQERSALFGQAASGKGERSDEPIFGGAGS